MAVGNGISSPVVYKDRLTGLSTTIAPASQGGYMKAFDQWAASAEAAKAKKEQDLKNTLDQNNATTNANYDNNARQAYVDYMRKKKALPGQLQALGVRGGATESGLLNLYNNYGSSHAANEQQRAAELATNLQNRDDVWNQYTENYDADWRNQYQTALANQMNEYNNEVTRFSSTVAQYPTTRAGYQKYKDWISNMKASSDPLKDIKIALIRQQMATQFPNGAPSSGSKSSGGGGGGGGGSSYSGYTYTNDGKDEQEKKESEALKAAKNTAKNMIALYGNVGKKSSKSSKSYKGSSAAYKKSLSRGGIW